MDNRGFGDTACPVASRPSRASVCRVWHGQVENDWSTRRWKPPRLSDYAVNTRCPPRSHVPPSRRTRGADSSPTFGKRVPSVALASGR